jgi:DNA-binding NtrC family response regulator
VVEQVGNTLSIVEGRRRSTDAVAPQPHLFLVLECSRPRVSLPARFSLAGVNEVVLGRGAVRAHARASEGGVRRLVIRVPDPWMSGTHATLSKVFGRWVLEDAGSKNGTVLNGTALTGDPKPRPFLGDGDLIELGHTFFIYRDAMMTPADEPPDVDAASFAAHGPGLATLIPALSQTFRRVEQVARSDLSVVLSGESGTGKEVLARAIHGLSGRSGAFVAVNCGALPETLIESELFGSKKGAFSGAEDRPGLVRAADRGTLFLDEIGDLPLPQQAAFLRVLQEREVVPVGGTRPVPVDLRVISASHRDIEALVGEELFREDLFARISGVKVDLPPLRERREDLGMLIATLLARTGTPPEHGRFDVLAARALFRYHWPRNIRELEKALAAAVVQASDAPIGLEHLPPEVRHALVAPVHFTAESEEENVDDEKLRDELVRLLREHKGNISAIARLKGKARMQIQRWCKRFKLDPESFRR